MRLIVRELMPRLRGLLVLAILFNLLSPPFLAGAGRDHRPIAGAARSDRALENKAAALPPTKVSGPAPVSRQRRSLTPPGEPHYHYAAAVVEATRIAVGDSDGQIAWSTPEAIAGPQDGIETQLRNSSNNDRGCIVVSFSGAVTLDNGAVQAYVHQPQAGTRGNILHLNRSFNVDAVRLGGVSPTTLEVVDSQGQPVTALGLTEEGWPSPNPLTARVGLHCPADAPLSCPDALEVEVGSAGQAARFYVYRSDLDPHPDCLGGPLGDDDLLNSYPAYKMLCSWIELYPGDSAVYTWDIWVHPSVTTTLNMTATWNSGQAVRAITIEQARIHPVLLLPGYIGTYPPQHGGKLDPLRHIYDHLIEGLERAGYETGPPGSGATLIPFGYDWRRPLSETGRVTLAGDVQKVRAVQDDPARRKGYVDYSRVDLIGHSAGGLAARAYLEDAAAANEQTVNQLITLAAPHRGIVSAYPAWYGGQLDISTSPLFVKAMLAGLIYCEADTGEERTAIDATDFYKPQFGNSRHVISSGARNP